MFAESRRKRSMRTPLVRAAWLCLAVCSFSGCAFKANLLSLFHEEQPSALPADANLSQIVGHLNSNIAHVHSWRSTKVTIVPHGSGAIGVRLQARIAVEEPQNFRLQVSAMGAKQADLGSNAEKFWFYMRPGQPKRVFFARHADIANLQRLPFEPQWVMEALGVVPMRQDGLRLQRPTGETGSLVELISGSTRGQNSPRHVVRVDTHAGHVIAHELYDASNQLIARAELSDYRPESVQGVMMPHQIGLDWPQFDFGMTMYLGDIEINPPTLPVATWTMPTIEGFPPLDLAEMARMQQMQQPLVERPPDNRRADAGTDRHYDGRKGEQGNIQPVGVQPWVPDTLQNDDPTLRRPPHKRCQWHCHCTRPAGSSWTVMATG